MGNFICVILYSVTRLTHSSNITKVWATVSSKTLKLFNEILLQDRPHWWFGCGRPYCPPVELLKGMTNKRYSRKIVPEFGRCPSASRSLSTLSRPLRMRICCGCGFNCPFSFSSSRFRILSRRHLRTGWSERWKDILTFEGL